MRRTLASLLALGIATSLEASTPQLSLVAKVYPDHGLPAVGPVIVAVITNESDQTVRIPGAELCLETADSTNPCNISTYTDWGRNWFDYQSSEGPFKVDPHGSKTVYPEFTGFDAKPLLQPGQYKLRVRLLYGNVTSNILTYTVDQPTGGDAIVWKSMVDLPQISESGPYADQSLSQVFRAHPTSDYYKIWAYWNDLSTARDLEANLRRLQNFIESGLPPAFETTVRLQLPGIYQALAVELAKKGVFDQAEAELNLGRAVVEQLEASSNPYAVAAATALSQTPPWTRDELEHDPAVMYAKKLPEGKPVTPYVDCVSINNNGTFTAWFGYDNSNIGIVGLDAGPQNAISPGAQNQGQPTVFQIGRQKQVFSVTAPIGQKIVWTLLRYQATATAQDHDSESDQPCGQRNDNDH